jgi:hypothetical protein
MRQVRPAAPRMTMLSSGPCVRHIITIAAVTKPSLSSLSPLTSPDFTTVLATFSSQLPRPIGLHHPEVGRSSPMRP